MAWATVARARVGLLQRRIRGAGNVRNEVVEGEVCGCSGAQEGAGLSKKAREADDCPEGLGGGLGTAGRGWEQRPKESGLGWTMAGRPATS